MNTPFLTQVARYYTSNENMRSMLSDTAFVFPNRRSCKQYERALAQELTASTVMPRLMSMNDLVDHINRGSNLVIAPPIEALFIAYKAYHEVTGRGDFDKFAFWGQLLVSDFNDVDMNLVNARELYSNLGDLKNIQAEYIDDDVKDAIKRILNVDLERNADGMWKQETEYKRLWDCMHSIYTKYGELLNHYHLTSQGKLYRKACDLLENMDADDLGFRRVVMVGHDVLSMSEMKIFKLLQKKKLAHYWWDTASPALDNKINPAARIMNDMNKIFAPPEGSKLEAINGFPQVTVQSVPSTIGQAKCAFEGLTALEPTTAIVLPDETMLEPLLNSLPDKLIEASGQKNPINITMGYQLKASNIATLMRLVTIAHRHAALKKDKWYFYREDVRNILSHPIVKMAFTEEVLMLNNAIESQNEFNIPATMMDGTGLEPVFKAFSVAGNDDNRQGNDAFMTTPLEVTGFIDRLHTFSQDLFDRVRQCESAIMGQPVDGEQDDEELGHEKLSIQCAFIKQYCGVLQRLRLAVDKIGLPVGSNTIFHLIDRMTTGAIIPFDGRSGSGLQVMGMLETRCLDFDDLRILSVNEGILPKGETIPTLIPERFRAAFLMPTTAGNDAALAYRFYRLISRASHVTLYYDVSDSSKCVPSRYIDQLDKVYHCPINRIKRKATVSNVPPLEITVTKEGLRVKETYTAGSDLDKEKNAACLSASSIHTFMNCPLQFYFQYIAHLSSDNDVTDFMDSSTFGTIVHDTLQDFYYPVPNAQGERKAVFTKDDINFFKKKNLEKVLKRNINRVYLKRTEEHYDDDLTGQAIILLETMKTYVTNALDYDIQCINDGSLEVVECEIDHRHKMKLGGTEFNLTYKADRIDRIGGTLRIIDYKTGSDKTSFSSAQVLTDTTTSGHSKGMMQVLLYSLAYEQQFGKELRDMGITTIKPCIYKLVNTKENGLTHSRNGQVELPVDGIEEHEVMKEYIPLMEEHLKKLLSDDHAFIQAPDPKKACTYCNFTDFCRK